MKVLVLGATGVIGGPVAQAFTRNGHEVYGSTRSATNTRDLQTKEITPLVGDEWKSILHNMDLVIDCTPAAGPDAARATLETIAAASRQRGPIYKISYIYSSGMWVHGNGDQRNGEPADERAPPKKSADLVAWRPGSEQEILTHPDVHGIVIRPSLLYGGNMSLMGDMFKQAMEGKIVWYGRPGGRYSLIHGDDLADLYVRVGEGAPLYRGMLFDATNAQSDNVDDILAKLVQVSGASGYSYRAPANLFEEAMTTKAFSHPSLGRALTGWVPKKLGLVDGMAIYYRTFVALQEQ